MPGHLEAIACISRSMWEKVTPDLRAVAYKLTDLSLAVRFVYASTPTQEQIEMVSVAETECMADFWQTHSVAYSAEALAVVQERTLAEGERWVYLRYEGR